MDNNQDRWWEHPEIDNRPPLPEENNYQMPNYPSQRINPNQNYYPQESPQSYQHPVDNGVNNEYRNINQQDGYQSFEQRFVQNPQQNESPNWQYQNIPAQMHQAPQWEQKQTRNFQQPVDEAPQIQENVPNPKKQKKQRNRRKLRFKDVFLLLIIFTIGFFSVQYFITDAMFKSVLSDEPFIYSCETDYRDYITNDIILPTFELDENSTYEAVWESSNPAIISETGKVTRPVDKNQTVTLTLKLQKHFWYASREYEFVVIKSGDMQEKDIFVLTQDMIDSGIAKNEFVITYHEDGSIYSIDGNFNNTLIESEADALKVINAYRGLLNIPSGLDFELNDIQTSLTGSIYYFVPIKSGTTIAGQKVVIATNNNYLRTISTTVKNVSNSDGSLTDEELIEIVKNHLNWNEATLLSCEKYLYNDSVAYQVTVLDEKTQKGIYELIIDVNTKTVISENNLLDSATEMVKGKGKDEQGVGHTFNVTKETGLLGDKYFMQDTSRNIAVIDGTLLNFAAYYYGDSKNIISNSKNVWDKYPQGVSAMRNLAYVYDWYSKNLNFISFDGKGQPIYCFIKAEKISEDILDNAAYVAGDVQVFFSGSKDSYFKYAPFTQLDVVAHEFTHGVFHHIANRSFSDTVMLESINEGYADIFGCLIEGNWKLGEKVIAKYDALRDPIGNLTNIPHSQPTTYLDENWDYTDGHTNSVLLSRAAYQMTEKGFSIEDVTRIWFQSMYYGYDEGSDFLTVRNHVEQAARALGYSDEQLIVIGDIFGEMKIGEMATKKVESFAVEGDRLMDNTTRRRYIVVFSPIATIIADTPIWIFEEDVNSSSTATDTQMSEFLSSYASSIMNEDVPSEESWNLTVDYRKYAPFAMDIMSFFVDDAKQNLIAQMTNASGMEEDDASIWLNVVFLTFKFEGTAYEFFSTVWELDYSNVSVGEDGNINYEFGN